MKDELEWYWGNRKEDESLVVLQQFRDDGGMKLGPIGGILMSWGTGKSILNG